MQATLSLRIIAEIARRFTSKTELGDEGAVLGRAIDAPDFCEGYRLLCNRFGHDKLDVSSWVSDAHPTVQNWYAKFAMGNTGEAFYLACSEDTSAGKFAIVQMAWLAKEVPDHVMFARRRMPAAERILPHAFLGLHYQGSDEHAMSVKVVMDRGFTKGRASRAKVIYDSLSAVKKHLTPFASDADIDVFLMYMLHDVYGMEEKIATKLTAAQLKCIEVVEPEFKAAREAAVSPF